MHRIWIAVLLISTAAAAQTAPPPKAPVDPGAQPTVSDAQKVAILKAQRQVLDDQLQFQQTQMYATMVAHSKELQALIAAATKTCAPAGLNPNDPTECLPLPPPKPASPPAPAKK
jgi:hypothetical protein